MPGVKSRLFKILGESRLWVALDQGTRLYDPKNPAGTHIGLSNYPMLVEVSDILWPGNFYAEDKKIREMTIVVFTNDIGKHHLIPHPADKILLETRKSLAVRFDDYEFEFRILQGKRAENVWRAFKKAIDEGKYGGI